LKSRSSIKKQVSGNDDEEKWRKRDVHERAVHQLHGSVVGTFWGEARMGTQGSSDIFLE